MSTGPTLRRIFAIPALIGLLTAAGLFAALLGDGWWDALAWLGMAVAATLSVKGLLSRRGCATAFRGRQSACQRQER